MSANQTNPPRSSDRVESTDRVWPSVSITFLSYNSRDELRTSLRQMLFESDYDASRVEAIVVDNASTDGSANMVSTEFPDVRTIEGKTNIGASALNGGFRVARGDYVLILDDDCYLPKDGLRRMVSAAQSAEADLVSIGVRSSYKPDFRFDHGYPTGLLAFWGCAWLIRREVLNQLGGYDPEIFVWGNEVELMLRFFDLGYRHLHMPEVVAVHMKEPGEGEYVLDHAYVVNTRHWAYVAAKLLRPREATGVLVALLAAHVRDAIRVDPRALRGIPHCLSGLLHGLHLRRPVANPELSRVYRRNFHSFASPWWVSRRPIEFIRRAEPGRRQAEYFASRARYYPKATATLEF